MSTNIQDDFSDALDSVARLDAAGKWELFELLQGELRKIAGSLMGRQCVSNTLQPTALVNEVFLRLAQYDGSVWTGRQHFIAVAARAMRQILIDRARSKMRQKRSGTGRRLAIESMAASSADEIRKLDVLKALDRLAESHPRSADIVFLHRWEEFELAEIAALLGVSERTIDREWREAKLLLARDLAEYR